MEKYFEIQKDSPFYQTYFSWIEDRKRINRAFGIIREDFGIETKEYYPRKDTLQIVPTQQDKLNFKDQLMKSDYGAFKKNSEVSKAWRDRMTDVNLIHKPMVGYHVSVYGRWSEQLFHIDDTLYGKIETNSEISLPDFCIPMKASEYYRIMEEAEEREKSEEEQEQAPALTM